MVLPVEMSVYVTTCTPVPLLEIYGYLIPCNIVLAVETTLLLVETSLHLLPRESVQMLRLSSLLILLCLCLNVHILPRSSLHVPPQASVLAVAVPRVYLSFFLTHSYEVTLLMDIGHIISTSRVI